MGNTPPRRKGKIGSLKVGQGETKIVQGTGEISNLPGVVGVDMIPGLEPRKPVLLEEKVDVHNQARRRQSDQTHQGRKV